MDTEQQKEYEEAARFMRRAASHIDKATDEQKQVLLKLLLQNPPEMSATTMATHVWKALSEKEFMNLMAQLQKSFDKEFWKFATRWR